MKPLVIAVAGLAGVGKDTFADGLLQMGFRRIALADNLKMMCQLLFDVSPWHTDTQEGKAAPLDPPVTITDDAMWQVFNYMGLSHRSINDMPDGTYTKIQAQFPVQIKTTRHLLQFVGTEICRAAITTYHTDVLMDKIQRETGEAGWVITDCRFGDERMKLKNKAGATLILVRRPGFEPKSGHASENSLGSESEYDFIIDNDGTIEQLHLKAAQLLRTLFGVYA